MTESGAPLLPRKEDASEGVESTPGKKAKHGERKKTKKHDHKGKGKKPTIIEEVPAAAAATTAAADGKAHSAKVEVV
jgi:hypothetical protein